jgi:hypothetical protein
MPADEEEDNEAVAGSLVDALVEANALELLVKRLTELNESVDEEASAVNNALGIIEHAVEVRGTGCGCGCACAAAHAQAPDALGHLMASLCGDAACTQGTGQ